MYAVIKTGGKQYRVQPGDTIVVEKLDGDAGAELKFDSVLMLGGDKGVGSLMGGLGGPDFLIEGLLAKWAYMALHLDHHRAIIGVRRTALLALSRLLHRRVSGRLKLH